VIAVVNMVRRGATGQALAFAAGTLRPETWSGLASTVARITTPQVYLAPLRMPLTTTGIAGDF
jgi:hypothetical protein